MPITTPSTVEYDGVNEKADQLFNCNIGAYVRSYIVHTMENDPPSMFGPEFLIGGWDEVTWNSNTCKSPIEQMLLAELMFMETGYGLGAIPVIDTPHEFRDCIRPQYEIERYKIDLAVFITLFSGAVLRIAVECDGHDYHSTKEQLRRDNRKSRWLQRNGWQVVRFTGSEIWRDAKACAKEVGSLIEAFYDSDIRGLGYGKN